MTRKDKIGAIISVIIFFILGCGAALTLHLIDRREAAVAPMPQGQTIDFSSYGFTLTVPDGNALNDYTANNRAEGDVAVFAGCTYDEAGQELYIFCYVNEARDNILAYPEQELVTHYMRAGAKDVRIRIFGGRRFVCYTADVQTPEGVQSWHTYETWDEDIQLTFETRMEQKDVLPILSTLVFTQDTPEPAQ